MQNYFNMMDYIENKLGNSMGLIPESRKFYLEVCRTIKETERISPKQKIIITEAYNKIFNALNPLDNCQDIPFQK